MCRYIAVGLQRMAEDSVLTEDGPRAIRRSIRSWRMEFFTALSCLLVIQWTFLFKERLGFAEDRVRPATMPQPAVALATGARRIQRGAVWMLGVNFPCHAALLLRADGRVVGRTLGETGRGNGGRGLPHVKSGARSA